MHNDTQMLSDTSTVLPPPSAHAPEKRSLAFCQHFGRIACSTQIRKGLLVLSSAEGERKKKTKTPKYPCLFFVKKNPSRESEVFFCRNNSKETVMRTTQFVADRRSVRRKLKKRQEGGAERQYASCSTKELCSEALLRSSRKQGGSRTPRSPEASNLGPPSRAATHALTDSSTSEH